MPYLDLNAIHNPSTGGIAPAAWGDQVRDNDEFLIDGPKCSVFNSAVQSVPTSTDSILTANSERYDNDGCHSTISQTSRTTIQTAGRYLLNANCKFLANATGVRKVEFLINGTTVLNGMLVGAANGTDTDLQATRTWTFAVGEYVEVRAYQSSGGNLDVTLLEFLANFEGR